MATGEAQTETVRWPVPDLQERPAVGTSCCVTTAEALVAQELSLLPGVEDIVIDTAAAAISITYRLGAVDQDQLAEALAEIGYPPLR